MLQPKRTKYRKAFKGRIHGIAKSGFTLTNGSHGLKSLEPNRVNARELEAARRALTREMKRLGKVWCRVFPDVPVSKKPIEVRMGKGKGAPEFWVVRVKPGRTRAAQNSGAPLPEPMRTSAGFFDTGTSGNTRIQTRPARFM